MVKLRVGLDAAVERRGRGRVVHVHVDELRSERAAERGSEVARLQPEDDVGSVVEHLELLDVVGAGLEGAVGGIGIVAGAIVIAVRIADVEQYRTGHEVEDHGAGRMRRAATRADGDDVEHDRATGDRHVDAERTTRTGRRRGDRRRRVGVGVRGRDVDPVARRSCCQSP